YQEHLNDELAKIGYYMIDGQPTVRAEYGPTGEAGDPFYRFTPVTGWTADQLNGTWNRAKSLLHLDQGTSSGTGTFADPAVWTASAPVSYSASAPSGVLENGFAPFTLSIASGIYGTTPIKVFVNPSERDAVAFDLQGAIDKALADWTAAQNGRADYSGKLTAS